MPASGPVTRLVFVEDVELTLKETGSGPGDFVQLVFDTPAATGAFAWNLAVNANNGVMFVSGPSGSGDSIDFFTDGSVLIQELQDLRLSNFNSPPIACTADREGFLYWDGSLAELCDCNGSSWQQVDGGGAC